MIDSDKYLLNGISGMGKSYYAKKKHIPEIVKKKPVIVFDRIGEYAGKGAKDVPKNWKKYPSFIDFTDKFFKTRKIEKEVHVISCQRDSDYILGLNFLVLLKKPLHIVLDEAQDIAKSSDFKSCKESLIRIARYGRHAGIGCTLISQRTMDIHPDIRSQFETVISFKQTSKSDVEAIKEKGFDDAEKIIDLKAYKYEIFTT